jgi:hypothetical protein
MPYDILTIEGEEIQSVLEVGSPGPGVPPGGSTGQTIQKQSAADFDTIWVTPASISLPAVGVAGTYGDTSHYPVITTDPQGRVSGVTVQPVPAGLPPGWINVKSAPYNALGNSIADDTAAIQAAINALTQTGTARGGTIYFPRSTIPRLSQFQRLSLAGAGDRVQQCGVRWCPSRLLSWHCWLRLLQ